MYMDQWDIRSKINHLFITLFLLSSLGVCIFEHEALEFKAKRLNTRLLRRLSATFRCEGDTKRDCFANGDIFINYWEMSPEVDLSLN